MNRLKDEAMTTKPFLRQYRLGIVLACAVGFVLFAANYLSRNFIREPVTSPAT